mmetsp:Transcript_94763/g.182075  ORF Transcript_94763/g.182075 Transcript_94763/m.182075 type:complete len:162 (-) Transcript_94763:74-559(-)
MIQYHCSESAFPQAIWKNEYLDKLVGEAEWKSIDCLLDKKKCTPQKSDECTNAECKTYVYVQLSNPELPYAFHVTYHGDQEIELSTQCAPPLPPCSKGKVGHRTGDTDKCGEDEPQGLHLLHDERAPPVYYLMDRWGNKWFDQEAIEKIPQDKLYLHAISQ